MFAQALLGSIGPVIVFVGGFIGLALAPTPVLATLPIACMIIGIALFMVPAVRVLAKIGRRNGFILAATYGLLNCLFAAYSIWLANFWIFCLAILNFGFMIAALQQFRFAAMESVEPEKAGEAISFMLVAGLIAAFIGPEVALSAKDWLDTEFIGAFLAMAVLFIPAILLLTFYVPINRSSETVDGEVRPLPKIAKQPVFLVSLIGATVAFSVMSFIMTATPISMHVHQGFDMAATKWVIQSHIIAMYLPSFFTGKLITRFGAAKVMYSGLVAFASCLMIGFGDQSYLHYWWALVLLGVGWNFMFVSATALLPQSYAPQERFKVQGFNDLVMFSCQAIASLSAGIVIKTVGWQFMLLLCVPLLLLAAWFVYVWQQNKNKEEV